MNSNGQDASERPEWLWTRIIELADWENMPGDQPYELRAYIEGLEADRDLWRGRANEMGHRWLKAEARIAELESQVMDMAVTIATEREQVAQLEKFLDDLATHDSDIELVPPAEEPCAECAHEYNSSECRQCKPPDWSHFTHEGEPPAEGLTMAKIHAAHKYMKDLTQAEDEPARILEPVLDGDTAPPADPYCQYCGERGQNCHCDIPPIGQPPAALTRDEEEILRDPRPGKGVIVTEGYAPLPAEGPEKSEADMGIEMLWPEEGEKNG